MLYFYPQEGQSKGEGSLVAGTASQRQGPSLEVGHWQRTQHHTRYTRTDTLPQTRALELTKVLKQKSIYFETKYSDTL